MDPSLIGVFDSGVGGLTVVRALERVLPERTLVYLGDTARVPYGTKSATTVARYASEAARFLDGHGVGMIVVACNTASAVGPVAAVSTTRTSASSSTTASAASVVNWPPTAATGRTTPRRVSF